MLKSIPKIIIKKFGSHKIGPSTVKLSKKFHKRKNSALPALKIISGRNEKIFARAAVAKTFRVSVSSMLIFLLSFGSLFFLIGAERAHADSQTFTATDTWQAPAGVTSLAITMRGGGAAGGPGAAGQLARGGGGGGGGAYTQCTVAVTPGNNYTVTVGATVSTGSGNASSLVADDGTCTANGGTTGTNATAGPGGTAQTVAGIVTAAFAGGAGGNGVNATNGAGGGGGEGARSTATGGVGSAGVTTTGGAGGTGGDGGDGGRGGDNGAGSPNIGSGLSPGGGGGGAGGSSDVVGAGARGEVLLEWTPPAPTTTLGDGTDGSNSTIAPGAAATEIDRFSFAANSGTDTVTALTVTLGPTDAFNNIATVDVQTTAGASKCSATPSSNTVSLTSCAIDVTTTPTDYKVMITSKSHVNMAAPATGASYATVATVTDWTGTNTHAGSDTDSATITVDNLSPANVTSASGSAGNTQVSLSWTNPADSDFEEMVVLRRASSAVTDVPVEGTSYATTTAIGSSVVACEGNMTSCTDTGLSNGTAYHYKIFAKDSRNNYSDTGVVPTGSPVTPLAAVTTIADGTNPSNATLAPGGSITDLDAFVLSTDTGTDSVTALTVTLASGTYAGLSEARVTSSDGATLYFAAVVPSGNTVAFSGGTPIPVSVTPTTFKVRITPKAHVDMAAPAGASHAVTGTVTSFTTTNTQSGTDSGSATITVDNLSPANVTSASGSAGNTQVSLSWTNPADSDFEEMVVLRRASSAVTDVPVEGTSYATTTAIGSSVVACEGNMTSCTDTGLSNGTAYHYKIFAKDSRNNYSATGVVPTGSPLTPVLTLTTTLASGTDPASASAAAGATDQELGQFTLATNDSTDSITALTVTTAGTAAIATIQIKSNDLVTQYFSTVSAPSGNSWSFSGGTPIPVSTSAATFKIIVSIKALAGLDYGDYAMTGYVSAFTGTNNQSGSDSAGTTLTLSNPAPVSSASPVGSSKPASELPVVETAVPIVTAVELNQVSGVLSAEEIGREVARISGELERIREELNKLEESLAARTEKPRDVAQAPAVPREEEKKSVPSLPLLVLPRPLALEVKLSLPTRNIEELNELSIRFARTEGELTRQARELIARGEGWSGRFASRVEKAKLALDQGIRDARGSIEDKIAGSETLATNLRNNLAEKLGSQVETTSKLMSVMPLLPKFNTDPRLAREVPSKKDVMILASGDLELVADQTKPVQTITSFRFTVKIEPSKPAQSIGGTFKYNDADKDGVWTAEGQLPPTSGRFAMSARIAYEDGTNKELRATTLIDPEGYVYEKTRRGELRVADAEVTLWQKSGLGWKKWPAENYNQKNPQTTDETGQYSFLALRGEYYIEIKAEDYKPHKSAPFQLEEAAPVNENIELEYSGESL